MEEGKGKEGLVQEGLRRAGRSKIDVGSVGRDGDARERGRKERDVSGVCTEVEGAKGAKGTRQIDKNAFVGR